MKKRSKDSKYSIVLISIKKIKFPPRIKNVPISQRIILNYWKLPIYIYIRFVSFCARNDGRNHEIQDISQRIVGGGVADRKGSESRSGCSGHSRHVLPGKGKSRVRRLSNGGFECYLLKLNCEQLTITLMNVQERRTKYLSYLHFRIYCYNISWSSPFKLYNKIN